MFIFLLKILPMELKKRILCITMTFPWCDFPLVGGCRSAPTCWLNALARLPPTTVLVGWEHRYNNTARTQFYLKYVLHPLPVQKIFNQVPSFQGSLFKGQLLLCYLTIFKIERFETVINSLLLLYLGVSDAGVNQ